MNIYNHILPLCEVKNYLRLDDDFTDDDAAIERMISSAFSFISKETNHIFKPQDKKYYRGNLERINVYDYPINTTDFGRNVPLYFSGFVAFCTDEIELNVGYTNRTDVPTDLIECALQIIKVWYYEAEKQTNTTLLPENVMEVLDNYRRYILC